MMRILYTYHFWDYARNGIGDYQGQKVVFINDNDGEFLEEDEYTPEMKKMMAQYRFNIADDDIIGTTEDYEIWYWPDFENDKLIEDRGRFRVRHKITFKLYKLPLVPSDQAGKEALRDAIRRLLRGIPDPNFPYLTTIKQEQIINPYN